MTTEILVIRSSNSRGQQGLQGESIAGTAGIDGNDGIGLLSNSTSAVTNNTNAINSLKAYTIPLGTLATNGDSLDAECLYEVDVVTGVKAAYFYLNGAAAHTKLTSFELAEGVKQARMKVSIIRMTSTTLFMKFVIKYYNEFYKFVGSESIFETGLACNDLDTLTNTIQFRGQASGAGDVIGAYHFLISEYLI